MNSESWLTRLMSERWQDLGKVLGPVLSRRSKKAAAQAESAALEADYEFARQSLAAAVARAYFSTIEAAEQEANDFAADTLFPSEFKRTLLNLRLDGREVIRFAQRLGVSPGLVVGQLQYHKLYTKEGTPILEWSGSHAN